MITPYVLTYALLGGGLPPIQPSKNEPARPSKHADGEMVGTPAQFADAADAFVKSLPVPQTKSDKEGGAK